MEASLANLKDAGSAGGKFMTGTFGKLIGSVAGIILLVTILRSTFYVVKVGQRGVLLRGGKPVLKQNGKWLNVLARLFAKARIRPVARFFQQWCDYRMRRQVGKYKVKRVGIHVKFPGWYDVDKVNIQQRIQKLEPFTVDCQDKMQRFFRIDLLTRVPCDDDGRAFVDFPALVVINSSEPDQVFESYAGTRLLSILERTPTEICEDRELLGKHLKDKATADFSRCGYLLEGVNVRERSLTKVQKAINAFAPQPAQQLDPSSNVVQLPHAVVTAAMELDIAETS